MCVQVCTKYHGVYKVLIFGARTTVGTRWQKPNGAKATHTQIYAFLRPFLMRAYCGNAVLKRAGFVCHLCTRPTKPTKWKGFQAVSRIKRGYLCQF